MRIYHQVNKDHVILLVTTPLHTYKVSFGDNYICPRFPQGDTCLKSCHMTKDFNNALKSLEEWQACLHQNSLAPLYHPDTLVKW